MIGSILYNLMLPIENITLYFFNNTLMASLNEVAQRDDSNEYEIVIIECCENCQTHQTYAKHSEWKYFEQFNQLKRKVEKFIPNTIVIKNPVPDELIKTTELKSQKNLFLNKITNQNIVFPRIGAFEIYIYNILISSKLMTTNWPNHYKIIQTITKIIDDKKHNNPLERYSVYNQNQEGLNLQQFPQEQKSKEKEKSNEKKVHRIVSKKKKVVNSLINKAYRSIQRNNQQKLTLDPLSAKLIDFDEDISPKKRNINRYLQLQKKNKDSKLDARELQSKADNRIKLPALNTSKGFEGRQIKDKKRLNASEKKDSQQREKREQLDGNQFNSLQFKQQISRQNFSFTTEHQRFQQQLKIMENRSVQYSDHNQKNFMNRSIQYEEDQGFFCDFALQVDNQILPKEITFQFVQTDKIELANETKPYLLDENIQVDIEIKKEQAEQQAQTIIKTYIDQNIATDMVSTVNRGYQFPEELVKSVHQNPDIDTSFIHLYQKRRNIVDNEHYSVDRFQEKATKYKWIGRADLVENLEEMKRKIFLQGMVFSVYNYYGIKSPERRLSYQLCANVVGEKMKEGAIHVMTSENPQLQYLFQFEEYSYEQQKYPLSQYVTFRSSKQLIKFNNYGGFLAIAYFLNDTQIFNQSNNQVGIVVVNQAIKEIHKMSCLNYQIYPHSKNNDKQIFVSLKNHTIKLERFSQTIEHEFFSMLVRLTNANHFQELLQYLRDIFIRNSSTYQHYKNTVASLKLDKPQDQVVEDFITMLTNRIEKIRQIFKGKLYTFIKYRTLNPVIKYVIPFENKLERRLLYKDKRVTLQEVTKHLRNKDNIVIIQGEDGLGKSTLLTDMSKQLKETQKLNVIEYLSLKKQQFMIKQELFQLSKNIVLIDNAEYFEAEIFILIERLRKYNFEISYCIATSKKNHNQIFKNRFVNLSVVDTKILAFDAEQLRTFLMKSIKQNSFTNKKDLIEQILSKKKYIQILQNAFYLNLFSHFLSRTNLQQFQLLDKHITKYMILKEHVNHCNSLHCQQIKQMGITVKEAFPSIRRIAFQYFHNKIEINQTIRDAITPFQENQLIRNQLVYYPLNLDTIIPTSYEALFAHNIFLKFYLCEAYSYFVQKGFRNLHMQMLYQNKQLMSAMRQRYQLEQSHSQLIQVVMQSKRFGNTTQASSNAITLLCKIGFIFSNINFDDCNIAEADLSTSTFYQCSFRSANLESAVLYKSQMINCILDNAQMARINLYAKKYEIEFAAMTASLSTDCRRIAFGCGNYLIIINAQTGAEFKRIEAHLDIIRIVRYTRDGSSLITIADDKTLRIWDVYTYKSVVFKLPQKGSISYSNQTQTIASVNKNTLKVWNLKSMANEAELQGHTELITTVQFSYDGSQIVTGSKDSTLRLWSLKGKQKAIYKGHNSEVLVAKIAPNRRTIISSSKDKDLIMWQTQTSNKIHDKKFTNDITQICLQDKESFIAVTYNNDNHIAILDFITFDILHVLSGHQAKIVSISFDHQFHSLLSLGKDRTARIWQLHHIMKTQRTAIKIKYKIHKGSVLCLAYDKAKRRYSTSHQNGEINLWEGEGNELIQQLMNQSGLVNCLSFDKLSRLFGGSSNGVLTIWDFQNKRDPKKIDLHSSQIISMRLSQKNRLVATSSIANQFVVYDYTGFSVVMSTREEGRINAIDFSHDEKTIAVGGVQRYVVLFTIVNGNTVTRSEELGVHSDSINCLSFFGDNLLVVALKNGQVAIWNYLKANLMKKIENVSSITNILPFQKKYICFTSQDGKSRIIDMDQGKEIKTFRYSEFPNTLALNHDETLLYSATNMGNILKWNLNCVRPKTKKIDFFRKAIDRDCSKIVTVQSNNSLNIKDLVYHCEQVISVKVDSDIEGVTFDDQDRMILLLKNGKYWQVKGGQYKFNKNGDYEGDLFFIRDRSYTNFFKSGIKKIKGMNKPALTIIQQINQ